MAPQVSGNTDINMYLQQAQGLFNQMGASMGGDASTYLNSIWSVGGNIEGLTSGDDNQKASAIQGLMKNVMSLIDKLSSNEAASARREVKANENESRRLNKTIEDQRNELNQQIGQIGGEISAQTGIVNGAVQELTDTQKAIQDKQEEINKIIAQIQAKQNELAGTTDPTKQAQLLSEIQGLSGQITTIISSISELSSTVEAASTKVEDATATIEDARGNAIELQEQGSAQIAEGAQNAAQLTHTTIKTNTTGVVNEATGETLQAAAETASSNVFSAGTAPELFRRATDQNLAGSERTRGAITNLQSIMQGIGGLNDNASILTNFNNSVGSALNQFDSAVGIWNQALEPTITSLGSFSTIEGEIATLDSTVKTDLGTLPEVNRKAGAHLAMHKKNESNIYGNVFSQLMNNVGTNPSDANPQNGEKVENTSGLQTPDVELTAFEIKKTEA